MGVYHVHRSIGVRFVDDGIGREFPRITDCLCEPESGFTVERELLCPADYVVADGLLKLENLSQDALQ